MKRFITLALTLALVFSLAACGAKAPAAQAPAQADENTAEEAPSAEDFCEKFFTPVISWHPGTAGSSLKLAMAACEVLKFAADEDLRNTDVPAMRDNMLKAFESLSAEDQAVFDENFMSIYALIDSCFEDWESNRGAFEDSGTAEEMAALLEDPTVRVSWEVLRNNTFTMGNSDGV